MDNYYGAVDAILYEIQSRSDILSYTCCMDHQEQLLKLTQLAPQPPDTSFLLGYLACSLRRETAIAVRPAVKRMIAHFEQGLITAINVLQMMAVLKLDIIPNAKKGKQSEEGGRVMTQIMTFLGELICDNNYLHLKYFEPRAPEGKAEDSLGVQCPICTVQITPMEVCYLSCSHMYHRNCFEGYAKEKIGSKIFPLRCPNEQCSVELLPEEVNEYLSRQLRQKYDQFTFHQYVQLHNADTSWCPTPGCQAVFSFDAALDNYKCPSCKQHYCLRCKCEMHANLTCKEYRKLAKMDEPDRQFMMLVKGARFKQCPNCKFWVEKNQGCDHMTCRCKYEFCYVCGGKYGACRCNGRAVEQPQDQEDAIDIIGIPPPPALVVPPPPSPIEVIPQPPSLPSLIQIRAPASVPPPRPLRIQSVSPVKSPPKPQISQILLPPSPSIGLNAAQVRQRWQRKQQFQPKRQRKLYVFGKSQRKPVQVQKEEKANIQQIDLERNNLKEPLISQIKQQKMEIQALKQRIQRTKRKVQNVYKPNQNSKWQEMFNKMHKLQSKLHFMSSSARQQKQSPK